jgi:hypothetical protein
VASIWPVWLASSSIACLPRSHQIGLFLLDQFQQRAGGGERLHAGIADDVDGAVRAHRQTVAQMRLGVGRGDGHDHDLGGDALVAQTQGFFQRDVVEGIGRQLDAVGDHAGAVRLDLDADVVVHHALVTDEDLHRSECPGSGRKGPLIVPVGQNPEF